MSARRLVLGHLNNMTRQMLLGRILLPGEHCQANPLLGFG
jgi:hypothetical protein